MSRLRHGQRTDEVIATRRQRANEISPFKIDEVLRSLSRIQLRLCRTAQAVRLGP